jgi:putative transposase
MTATLNDVAKRKEVEQSAEQQAAVELVRMAKEQGLSLTGPDGLLKPLTKTLIETALNEEMTEHFGYEKHDPAGAGTVWGSITSAGRVCWVRRDRSGGVLCSVCNVPGAARSDRDPRAWGCVEGRRVAGAAA